MLLLFFSWVGGVTACLGWGCLFSFSVSFVGVCRFVCALCPLWVSGWNVEYHCCRVSS